MGWSGRYGLERLDPDGLHTVPGDRIQVTGSAVEDYPYPSMREIAGRGLVLINTHQGWCTPYDGRRVSLIPGSGPDEIGKFGRAFDLSSIGKVFIKTERGLFELAPNGHLVPFPVPFPVTSIGSLSELPVGHVGLMATKNNLYALSASGIVLPIEGGATETYDTAGLGPFAGVIAERNAMLVQGHDALHMIVYGPASAVNYCTDAPTPDVR